MALAVLALSGAPLPAQTELAAPASAPAQEQEQVVEVRILGNRAVPARKIGAELRTRAGRPFEIATVEEDVRRLTRTGLFVQVKPYTQSVPGGKLVIFEVLERPTIQYIKFVGNEIMRDKYLLKAVQMKVGDALDLMEVQEGCRKLEDFYEEKGYSRVRVTVVEGSKPTDRGVAYLIDEGRKEKIFWTSFEGNRIATDARLRTVVQGKQGFFWIFKGELNRDTVAEDKNRLAAYYRGLGFFDAKIEPDSVPNDERTWWRVKWVIDEGPRYKVRNVSVLGNEVYTSDELLSDIQLKPGDYFNQSKQVGDRATISDLYGCVGYAFCSVKPETRFSEQPGQVDLVYAIEEGDPYRVGRINVEITGDNPHTQIATVLDRMSIRPGDIFDVREVRSSERRLKASGLFLNDPTKGSVPSIVFSPPELDEEETQMAGKKPAARGQSPDGATTRMAYRPVASDGFKTLELDVVAQMAPQTSGIGVEVAGPPQTIRVSFGMPIPGSPVASAAAAALGTTAWGAPTSVQYLTPAAGQAASPAAASSIYQRAGQQPQQDISARAEAVPTAARSTYAHPASATPLPELPPAWRGAASAPVPSIYTRPVPGPPLREMQLRWRNPSAGETAETDVARLTTVNRPTESEASTSPVIPPAWSPQRTGSSVARRSGQRIVRAQDYSTDGGYAVPTLSPTDATAGTTYPETGSGEVLVRGATPPLPANSATLGAASPAGIATEQPVVQQPYPVYGNPNYTAPQPPDVNPAIPGVPPGDGNILMPPTSPFDAAALDEEYRPLDFSVRSRETETGKLMLGVGVNSDAGLTGQIMYEEQNFNIARMPSDWEDIRTFTAFRGAGQRLRIEAVPGTSTQRYMVTFTEPYLLHTPVSLGLSGFYFDRNYSEWDETRTGGRVSLGYQLTPDLSVSAAFRGMEVEISDPVEPTPPEIAEVIGSNTLLGFGLTVTHDTRDSTFFATEGHLVELSLEQVTGSFTYPKADLDIRKFFMLHERPDGSGRHVLQLSSQFGYTGDETPVYEHYFIGGFSTLRGFDYRGASTRSLGSVVGGEFKMLASIQYVFPITADDTLRGVVFCDSGTTQPTIDEWTDDYRVAVGFGLRITIPAMGPAPIALDLAVPVAHNPGDEIENFAFFMGINH